MQGWTERVPGGWKARWRSPDGRKPSKKFRRRSDAERFLTLLEADLLRGTYVDPRAGRVRLERFASEWISTKVHLRKSTRTRYEGLLRVHILRRLGRLPLNAIRPTDVQAFVAEMYASGLAPGTVRQAYVVLSQILSAAETNGLINRSPAVGVKLPSPAREEQRYLTADQVALLAKAIHPRYRALVLLGAYGALRWGELAGLRAARLRLLQRRIDVLETLIEVQGRLVAGPPKTGPRTISIPVSVAEELSHHLATHAKGPNGLLFTSPEGGPLRYRAFLQRFWRPAVERARLAPLRIHDLRHTAVALAVAAGAHPKEIQELCGHASIGTTLNVYGHLFEALQDRLAERLADTFRASRAALVLA